MRLIYIWHYSFSVLSKQKNYIQSIAEIIIAYGLVNRNYDSRKYAKAVYTHDGKQIVGKMICAYDSRVEKGNKVNIIVPKNNLKIFAFSEKQVKNAVMTYSVFTMLFACCFIVVTVVCVYLYLGGKI